MIWLSPVYRSPQADNGYDISDYRDIDPLFGTLADFDALLARVHELGMKLVMDLVVNHTSDEHPWFVESRSSRDNPKRDWYIWRDARDGAEPNNWGSIFGGSAWQWDPSTEQYYLHLFDRKQPDLNWKNPQVRNAVHDIMSWWLDRGVDGFRMDVINFISKADGLPDAPAIPGQTLRQRHRRVRRRTTRARLPRRDDPRRLRGPRRRLHHRRRDARRDNGSGAALHRSGSRELNMVFQFEHMSVDQGPADKFDYVGLDLVALKTSLHRWQLALADVGWNSLYWNNHDQPRVVSRFGDDDPDYWAASAKALATVLHGMRGTPFVYQGEELGMTNYPFRIPQDYKDLESVNYFDHVVRTGRRRRVRRWPVWPRSAATTPARPCSGTRGRTPDSPPPTRGCRSIPTTPGSTPQPRSTQRIRFSRTIGRSSAFATSSPVLVDGDFTPLMADDPQIWAYTRTTPDRRTPRGRQLRAQSTDRRDRTGMGRRQSAARQPARHRSHVDVNFCGPRRLGRAHLLRPTPRWRRRRLTPCGGRAGRCSPG